MIVPDGIRAAATREKEFHPKANDLKQTPISAWDRRAETLEATIAAVNRHEEAIAALPFPFAGSS